MQTRLVFASEVYKNHRWYDTIGTTASDSLVAAAYYRLHRKLAMQAFSQAFCVRQSSNIYKKKVSFFLFFLTSY